MKEPIVVADIHSVYYLGRRGLFNPELVITSHRGELYNFPPSINELSMKNRSKDTIAVIDRFDSTHYVSFNAEFSHFNSRYSKITITAPELSSKDPNYYLQISRHDGSISKFFWTPAKEFGDWNLALVGEPNITVIRFEKGCWPTKSTFLVYPLIKDSDIMVFLLVFSFCYKHNEKRRSRSFKCVW